MDRAFQVINGILFDAAIWFFLVAAAFAVTLGLGLLLRARWVTALAARMNTSVSMQPAFSRLDRRVHTEPAFYRRHRLWGSIIMLGALLFGAACVAHLNDPRLLRAVAGPNPHVIARWLVDAATWFLIVGNVAAFAVGAAVFIRPSSLKRAEDWANRWVHVGGNLEPWERDHDVAERFFARHPRLIGGFLVLGGAYIAYQLVALLYRAGP